LGLLHGHRPSVLLVAADPGPALRARLPRRPRGRAPPGDEPLAALLAPGRIGVPRDPRGARLAQQGRRAPPRYRGLKAPRRAHTGRVIRSTSAISSALSFQPAALTLVSICSGLVAPVMIEATVGRAASHDRASSSSVWPR